MSEPAPEETPQPVGLMAGLSITATAVVTRPDGSTDEEDRL